MIVVANPPEGFLNRLTWALFWRCALLGVVSNVAIGFAIGFLASLVYLILSGGSRAEPPASYTFAHDALIAIGCLAANFFILKWAIRSRLGQVVQGHTIVTVAVNTDKDTSHAN